MRNRKCPICGWHLGLDVDHQTHATAHAERVGGIRARRHIKKAAKDDRNRASRAKIAKLIGRG